MCLEKVKNLNFEILVKKNKLNCLGITVAQQ